jgi:hypothetical protein
MSELLLTLKTENIELKEQNEKMYRKTKNQQRSILRLKQIIEKQNGFLKRVKQNNLDDQDWEDLDDLVKEYELPE